MYSKNPKAVDYISVDIFRLDLKWFLGIFTLFWDKLFDISYLPRMKMAQAISYSSKSWGWDLGNLLVEEKL